MKLSERINQDMVQVYEESKECVPINPFYLEGLKEMLKQAETLESIAAALVKWDADWPPYGPEDRPDYTKEDQDKCHEQLRAIITKAQEVTKES